MKTSVALFLVLFLAGSVFAQGGIYNMAKQQARNAVAGENRNQQAIESSDHASPTPPPQNNPQPAQPDPALQATLQNISNLRVDFNDLGSGRTNTAALQNDLTTAAQGAKPPPDTITRLAGNLAAIVSGNEKLQAQHQKLAQYVHAVFNSSHLSAVQQQTVMDTVQKILSEGGASADNVAKVIADLKAVAAATK
jgi:hypothetical protein